MPGNILQLVHTLLLGSSAGHLLLPKLRQIRLLLLRLLRRLASSGLLLTSSSCLRLLLQGVVCCCRRLLLGCRHCCSHSIRPHCSAAASPSSVCQARLLHNHRQRLAGAQPPHAACRPGAVKGGAGVPREGRQRGAECRLLVLGSIALDVSWKLLLVCSRRPAACAWATEEGFSTVRTRLGKPVTAQLNSSSRNARQPAYTAPTHLLRT